MARATEAPAVALKRKEDGTMKTLMMTTLLSLATGAAARTDASGNPAETRPLSAMEQLAQRAEEPLPRRPAFPVLEPGEASGLGALAASRCVPWGYCTDEWARLEPDGTRVTRALRGDGCAGARCAELTLAVIRETGDRSESLATFLHLDGAGNMTGRSRTHYRRERSGATTSSVERPMSDEEARAAAREEARFWLARKAPNDPNDPNDRRPPP